MLSYAGGGGGGGGVFQNFFLKNGAILWVPVCFLVRISSLF